MKKFAIEIKWALIFVAMSLLWMLGERLAGLHDVHIDKQELYTNFYAIPAILIYVLAFIDKKNNYYGGSMRYMQGFKTGLVITLIITVFTPLSQYITTTFITPDYFPNVIEHTVESGKMSQEEAEKYFSLKNYILINLVSAPIIGIITSAFVAIFIRKGK